MKCMQEHVSPGSFKKKFCSSFFGFWGLAFFYFLNCFHGNTHRGVKQQMIQLFLSFLWIMRPTAYFNQLTSQWSETFIQKNWYDPMLICQNTEGVHASLSKCWRGTCGSVRMLNPLTAAIGRPFFGHKSPDARARELWKLSTRIQQVF